MSDPDQPPQFPAYSPPPYGPPGGYPPPPGFYGPRTNPLAVISFIASLVGVVGLIPIAAPIAGVILGHLSLSQIQRTGEGGRGLALAGVIIGYAAIALGIIGIFLLLFAFAVWIPWAALESPGPPPNYATP